MWSLGSKPMDAALSTFGDSGVKGLKKATITYPGLTSSGTGRAMMLGVPDCQGCKRPNTNLPFVRI